MKLKKKNIATIAVIIIVIILAIILINSSSNGVSKETTLCIAGNSTLYIQLGCHACETQEKMFGNNYQYLNTVDCFYDRDKCSDIQYTPTWIINEEKYTGVQTIEELKELTGC